MKNINHTDQGKINPLVMDGLAVAGAAAVLLSKKGNRDKVAKAAQQAKTKGEKFAQGTVDALEKFRKEPIVKQAGKKASVAKTKLKTAKRERN